MNPRAMRLQCSDGLVLNARLWGGANPARLFLVHGFAQGSFVWQALAAAMPEFTMAAVDLRGHGDSDHDPLRRYSLSNHVEDVIGVARAVDLEDYVLVGHSLGAMVALLACERLPSRPRGLVLVDGGPAMSESASTFIREEFLRLRFRYRSVAEYSQYLQTTLPFAPVPLLDDVATESLTQVGAEEFRLKADRALAFEERNDRSDAELWSALRRLQIPLLVVRGAASAVCSKAWGETMIANATHASIATVDRAGHAVMLDNPASFNSIVRTFVSQHLRDVLHPPQLAYSVV